MSSPPLAPLRLVSGRLGAAGILHALGGSGLRRALGDDCDVGDWDLTTDGDPEVVHRVLVGLDHRLLPAREPWASQRAWRIDLDGAGVDVIVGFAVRSGAGIRRFPTVVTGAWRGVPLGDPVAWQEAMSLAGRGPGRRYNARAPRV